MYSPVQLASKYLHYYVTASAVRSIEGEAPAIKKLVAALSDKTKYTDYDTVENLRKVLLQNKKVLSVTDFGAGSTASKSNERSVASIAENAAKSPKFCQLLYRMVRTYQPETVLELGTSLGVTTAYFSLANRNAAVWTLEGATAVAEQAGTNFNALGLKNISLIEGNFDETLSAALQQAPNPDFVFIDGNHRQEPTERYFKQLLPHLHEHSVLIFDDIHWSKEMEQAWDTIKNHKAVRYTADLFFIGIVFFNKEITQKAHVTIRY